jgi:pimeloyl-ACP methyl ester carboxylesterase
MTYFRGKIGAPTRVIAWGNSLGGLTAVQLAEDYPRSIDGAIGHCPVILGYSVRMDSALDFAVAYAAAFGWPESWGPIGDLRTGLAADFAKDVAPKVVRPDTTNRGKWEFIRLVMGFPTEAFWQADPVNGSPGMFLSIWATTYMREMLESAAAGPVATNGGKRYTLTPEEKTYLAGLGANADDLLAKMNASNEIAANSRSREYIKKYGDPRAMPRRPLLTVHNTLDCMSDTRWERVYRDEVEAIGLSANLAQAYVKGVGHCGFSSKQLLAALKAMERWLETGVKPDATFFPEAEGFDNTFVPPVWPKR